MRSVHFVAGLHVAGSTNVSAFRSSSSLLLILVCVCVCVCLCRVSPSRSHWDYCGVFPPGVSVSVVVIVLLGRALLLFGRCS